MVRELIPLSDNILKHVHAAAFALDDLSDCDEPSYVTSFHFHHAFRSYSFLKAEERENVSVKAL